MPQFKKNGNVFHGTIAFLALIISTIMVFIPFFVISLLKLYPSSSWRIFCTNVLQAISTFWIDINNLYIRATQPARLIISGTDAVHPNNWYLIVANHQSWLDIVILQYVFNHSVRIPLLKFFIKSQLIWVPVLGFCWWAMGYPFMKRYSKEYLAKNPHKHGQDLKSTLKAVDQFKKLPASIVSFIEGTRFTPPKNQQQEAPYQFLLKPKAGGISFVIGAMHEEIDSLLDVSIIYPDGHNSIWDFVCHRIDAIQIHIRRLPIPTEFRNPSLLENEHVQSAFRTWLNEQWLQKDQLISGIKAGSLLGHISQK